MNEQRATVFRPVLARKSSAKNGTENDFSTVFHINTKNEYSSIYFFPWHTMNPLIPRIQMSQKN